MVCCMEKVDGEFMTELREISEMRWTGAKSYWGYIKTINGQFSPAVIDHLPFCCKKKHIWRKTDKENEGELTT